MDDSLGKKKKEEEEEEEEKKVCLVYGLRRRFSYFPPPPTTLLPWFFVLGKIWQRLVSEGDDRTAVSMVAFSLSSFFSQLHNVWRHYSACMEETGCGYVEQ